ncbi:DUF4153 domain-containing protein [Micromonosporaceae bacterium Da 78-11]
MSVPAPAQVKRPPAAVAPLHGPWPATSLWSHRWPGTGRPATPATLAAVFGAAVVAALSIPLDRAGVGWLVTAVVGTLALIVARAVGDRSTAGPAPLVTHPTVHGGRDRYGWGVATVTLLGVGTFRSAGWLFALCLLVAALTTTLALTGGRSLRGIAAAATMPVLAAFRSVPWLTRGLRRLQRPEGPGTNVRIAATVAVSITLLTVFGALLASADAAFADALSTAIPDVNIGTGFRWAFVFGVAVLALGGAAYLRAAPPDLSGLDATEGRKVNRLEWAIPLGLLALLFAAFVAVQLNGLFGGERHVLDTDGLTYAGYARGGFWQLSFVTGLTLVVLAGAARWAPREQAADRLLIRSIFGALALLTLVIVGSALHRMNVYADTYGLTRLRLLVACCSAWFGLVLVLVLAAGLRIRAPWLPRVAIATGVLALLGLAVANPDRLIAEHNIEQSRTVDLNYLGTLSPDAVPALMKLDPARRGCVVGPVGADLRADPDDWRGWNLAREQARRLIGQEYRDYSIRCP